MPYKSKVFVAFDGEADLQFYNKMKEFKDSNNESFDLINCYDFKSKFDKVSDEILKVEIHKRMSEAQVIVVFVSKTTKSMRRFIKWQVDYAVNNNFPIIAMNLNQIKSVDFDLIPTVLKRSTLSVHIPFNEKIFELALENWPKTHKSLFMKEKKGTFRYPLSVYESIVNYNNEVEAEEDY